jgi:hypothetical protein
MTQYGTCECNYCYVRIPKPNAYKVTIECETGRSGAAIAFIAKAKAAVILVVERIMPNEIFGFARTAILSFAPSKGEMP